jgi:hypothetical protein
MIEEIDSDGSGTVDFDGKLHDGRYRIGSYPFQISREIGGIYIPY